VVGIDDVLVASLSVPRLTTVRQPLFEMGRKAAELLVGRIEGTDSDHFKPDHVLQPELIVRDSTARVRL
jgi:DNA-binding LacI/PurR family transcriptional regulator